MQGWKRIRVNSPAAENAENELLDFTFSIPLQIPGAICKGGPYVPENTFTGSNPASGNDNANRMDQTVEQ